MTAPMVVRDVHEAAALIDAGERESMTLRDCRFSALHGMAEIRDLVSELGEREFVTGVAFIALLEDGSARFVVAGESYRATQKLWRSVQ